MGQLRLRVAPDGKVCLYHGMANNLAERNKWHAAQKLSPKCLRSDFLSTFRFTLLALNDFEYLGGSTQIDGYFDSISVSWQAANTRDEAESLERSELQGTYHYPLNIQGNRRPELVGWVRHLKATRSPTRAAIRDVEARTHVSPGVNATKCTNGLPRLLRQ